MDCRRWVVNVLQVGSIESPWKVWGWARSPIEAAGGSHGKANVSRGHARSATARTSPRSAVAGFLRDDGTAVCKRLDWKANELSLYKVVLLNTPELRRLGVEYQRDLQMYEDICLNHEVLRHEGRTLKCQRFCFRASHRKTGGCAEVQGVVKTRKGTGTELDDLVSPKAYRRLSSEAQQVMIELLGWIQAREEHSLARSGQDYRNMERNGRISGDRSQTVGQNVQQNNETAGLQLKRPADSFDKEEKLALRREGRDHREEYVIVKRRRTALKDLEGTWESSGKQFVISAKKITQDGRDYQLSCVLTAEGGLLLRASSSFCGGSAQFTSNTITFANGMVYSRSVQDNLRRDNDGASSSSHSASCSDGSDA